MATALALSLWQLLPAGVGRLDLYYDTCWKVGQCVWWEVPGRTDDPLPVVASWISGSGSQHCRVQSLECFDSKQTFICIFYNKLHVSASDTVHHQMRGQTKRFKAATEATRPQSHTSLVCIVTLLALNGDALGLKRQLFPGETWTVPVWDVIGKEDAFPQGHITHRLIFGTIARKRTLGTDVQIH